VQAQVTPTPGPFLQANRFGDHDEFTSLFLENATVQFGQVSLPYICRGSPSGDRLMFILHLRPLTDYVWKGQILDPRAIMFLPPHTEHQDITPPDSFWALVTIERAHLEKALASLHDAEPPLDSHTSRVLLPESGPFEGLRRRLRAIHVAVSLDPSFINVPEARRGVEESILVALARALGSASRVRPNGYGAATHARAARQVEAYLSTTLGESLYLGDLCAVAGVGERTLRYVFQERFGMSPVRYLKLRRLHQARRALRRADPDLNTVQSIANRCGIWHMSRFAQEYRALFNEHPLDTLRKTCLLEHVERFPAPSTPPRRGTPSVRGLD
jgi:AraC-like DNA-binding protein